MKSNSQRGHTDAVAPSATVEISRKIYELKRSGIELIELNVGEPDFTTPEVIKSAAKTAIDANFTRYSPVAGIHELREGICRKFKADNKLAYQPNEIIVTTGAKQALFLAIMALCQAGDEVIIAIPCWSSFIEMVKISGGRPVLVKTDHRNNFRIDPDKIARAISPNTKAVIINSPNNPTGAVYNQSDLKMLVDLADAHAFYLLSDEIYEKVIYDDRQHHSIAALSPSGKERTVVVNGLSKTYAMTGWRIGYAAGPENIIQKMGTLQGHMTTATNSISQKAALAALTGTQTDVHERCRIYQERRDFILQRLLEIPRVTCSDIQGTFYAFPHIARYFNTAYRTHHIRTSTDLTHFLLLEGGVAVVPGDAFQAPDHIRISFTNSMDNLKKGCEQIARCLALLR
jgi:aspartate aminotransferase